MRTLNRTEFTIIALLIIVLLAIGLPWILSSRENARLHSCTNKLKHVGLSFGNHLEIYEAFPPGTVTNRELLAQDRLGWTVGLLTFIDPQTRYSFDFEKGWKAPSNRAPTVTTGLDGDTKTHPRHRNPFYRCPADDIDSPSDKLQFSSYVAIAGLGRDAPTLPAGHPSAGIFGYDRKTSLAEFGENREHTICVLDTSRDNGPWTSGGPPTLRPFLPDDSPFIGPGRQFGGHHADRAVALMADFRVREFSTKTDRGVFAKLCTVGGK